jgi:hypothetical protein
VLGFRESQGEASTREPGAIYVTGHDLGLGQGHLALEFQPDAETTPQTISGSPDTMTGINERLVGGLNRETDQPALNRTVASVVPPAGVSTSAYWATLGGALAAYGNGLDYDLGAGVLPGRLGDGYNSNGFVTGIVRATGGRIIGNLSGFPGAGRPVPGGSFGR